MFKLVAFIRSDGDTINPFDCKYLCSYVRDGVVVMTQMMFESMDGYASIDTFGIGISTIIIIGDKSSVLESGLNKTNHPIYVDDINHCIKYLSAKCNSKSWWFIGDNKTSNHLIENGLIMDVHLSKSYATQHSTEWYRLTKHTLSQSTLFNKTLLDDPINEFELISTTRSDKLDSKTIRHYMRRNIEESNLLNAMNQIIQQGFKRPNRTGVDTRSLFGKQFEYKMVEKIDSETGKSSYRLPLLTTKKMFVRGVFGELKWFLSGGTDSKELETQGINIWKGNSSRKFLDATGKSHYDEGECGPIYGFQWRHTGAQYVHGKKDYTGEGIDQVQNVIKSLQEDPFSRRHIISGWNVKDLDQMVLPPCHVLYQFLVSEHKGQKYLSLSMYQRSADTFLGVPFNVCSLGMFLLIMAHRVNMKPLSIHHSIGDMHIYENHIEAASKQIQRDPCMFPYISINCDPKEKIEDYNLEDISIDDYYHHNLIKADMIA